MILDCHNIDLSFGENEVLKKVSFHIEENEKAALVGINGAGKTTLLRIITGESSADGGSVTFRKGSSFGYLAQYQDTASENTIFDELMLVKKDTLSAEERMRELEEMMKDADGERLASLYSEYDRLKSSFEDENGYAVKSEVTGILKGLGFREKDFGARINELSGGQKTRVFLGKLLLQKPDIIFLDEPTNHLDIDSVIWLENYLSSFRGACIIVSHDRYFLDRTVTKVIELENGRASVYMGNYTAFSMKKARLREAALKAYYNQQREIKHQKEVIEKLKSFNREKSVKRAESREKQLGKIELLEKPQELDDQMRLSLTPDIESGLEVLHVEHLSKSFGEKHLFREIGFDIKRGEHIALIGANGTGKTTILKILNRLVPPDTGMIRIGANVHIGYYDQEQQRLSPDKTIFQEIYDTWPKLTGTRIRNMLAAFLFTGDDVFKYIRDLSGGERGRVSLAKLMLSECNFLILDEPTNHLDTASKEILENAVRHYAGTVLLVSHDRYFINRTAHRILELTSSGLAAYNGNYDYYLEHRGNPDFSGSSGIAVGDDSDAAAGKASSSSKEEYAIRKEQNALARKRKNQLDHTMSRLSEIEKELAELDSMLLDENIATDPAELVKISERQQALTAEQDELMELWMELESEEN
ncbi:MAG: ABC-F family ATP-binding cassette domain-containing protein [Lachnospiraceae bacterium]|nr:ABC-F family ATP-binding cassette domain-containing protein [Lachnospiraceae bacterium]